MRVSIGGRFVTDARTAKQIPAAEKILGHRLTILQGSYHPGIGASSGTHDEGGVLDVKPGRDNAETNRVVRALRLVGFAAWLRTPDEGPWGPHVHAVSVGCPDLAPIAARQVEALRRGRNGLRSNALDRHRGLGLPVTTWEKFLAGQGKPTTTKVDQDITVTTSRKHYTVRPGDTLTAIAARVGTTVAALVRLNKLTDPDLIRAGDKLKLPKEKP